MLRRRGRSAGGRRLQIQRLSADHARSARRFGDDRDRRELAPRELGFGDKRRGNGLAGKERECLGQQAVAGENRHAFAKDHVCRRPSAPQRVVVHRRKIVMDERVGMDQLDGAGRRHRERRHVDVAETVRFGYRLGGGQHEHRAQPLAPSHDAVAHGLAHRRRGVWRRRQPTAERGVDREAALAQPGLQIGRPRGGHFFPAVSLPRPSAGGASLISPRSFSISIRRSAPSSFEWQKRASCTPRS